MEFFYKNEISALAVNCPPGEYIPVDMQCYRWVYDTMDHPDNFKAQSDKNPKVLKNKSDERKCEYWALSFHNSLQNSIDGFEFLAEHVCNGDRSVAYKRFGLNIAHGVLGANDGVAGKPNNAGHFNYHHVKDHTFATTFKIIQPL